MPYQMIDIILPYPSLSGSMCFVRFCARQVQCLCSYFLTVRLHVGGTQRFSSVFIHRRLLSQSSAHITVCFSSGRAGQARMFPWFQSLKAPDMPNTWLSCFAGHLSFSEPLLSHRFLCHVTWPVKAANSHSKKTPDPSKHIHQRPPVR